MTQQATHTRVTYRQVLRVREFRAIFIATSLSLAGDQIARIAIALLVFERTGSPFAASATYGLSYFTWLVGGPVLSVLADRRSRRRIMIVADVARGLLIALLLGSSPPLALVFAVLFLVGVLTPPFESARSALMPDILEGEEFIAGNALSNTMIQAAQVGGFFFGGLLVAAFSARGAIALDVASFAVSAIVITLFVRERPAPTGARARHFADMTAGFAFVGREPLLRALLGYGVLASVVAIVPEGLAVAVAADAGDGALATGVLTATLPFGYVVASALFLRVPDDRRLGLLRPLTILLCVPLLLTPFVHNTPATAVLWIIAGLGTVVQLVAGATFVRSTPAEFRGRAYGIASTCLMISQGAALLLAGWLANLTNARNVVALASAAVLFGLLAVRTTAPRAT